ncbi:hypothetical protein ACR0ST_12395 [Aliidiomarina sp. Khilg15.8]
MRHAGRIILAFIIAVVVAGLLGSVFQTQLNLAALSPIAPPIGFAMRLESTLHDLVHFAPLYTVIVLCTLLIAIPLAELVARLAPGNRLLWVTLGCMAALLTTFEIINALAPMPTLIAATRTPGGTLLMLLSIAIAAVVYSLMMTTRTQESPL